MLKSITIENFFSFGKPTKIELNAGLNILVGINASGKSTIIKALQLLYETVCGKGYEKLIMEDWGGFEAVQNYTIQEKHIIVIFEFSKDYLNKFSEEKWTENPIYFLGISKNKNNVVQAFDSLYTKNADGSMILHLYREYTEQNVYKIFYEVNGEKKTTDDIYNGLLIRSIIDSKIIQTLRSSVFLIQTYYSFDVSLKSKIRAATAYTTEYSLSTTGENLTTVLQHIKNYYSLSYEQIETLLQKVNPHFKDISFGILGSRSILTLREKKLNRTILSDHISEGTLRFLLLLAITCNPARGSLVCLDEPDMGLHPDMISTIADTLKEAAKTSQFIISTHSPLLLNEFDLEDIIVIEKDADNQSIAKTFNADDFAEWSNQYLAGQLWLMGKLGGKRW
jgi:predicted ATPase